MVKNCLGCEVSPGSRARPARRGCPRGTGSYWPSAGAARRERRYELIKEEFLAECRLRSLEPPSADQADRYVRSALSQAGKLLAGRVAGRLASETLGKLLTLIGVGDDRGQDEEPGLLRKIKSSPGASSPGAVSLATMLGEIGKLTAIVSFGLPGGLFADVAPRVVREWRDQAITESPSHTRSHPPELQVALLSALLCCRGREITDALVHVLLSTVRRIGARAERRVTTQLVSAFKRVQGKEGLLFRVADASLAQASSHPARAGGNPRCETPAPAAAGSAHCGSGWCRRTGRSSAPSGDTPAPTTCTQPPDSADSPRPPPGTPRCAPDHPGAGSGLPDRWKGQGWVVRAVYEIRTFEALCAQLRCKGIWVVGADEFRNPGEDLVTDSAEHRTEHYAELRNGRSSAPTPRSATARPVPAHPASDPRNMASSSNGAAVISL